MKFLRKPALAILCVSGMLSQLGPTPAVSFAAETAETVPADVSSSLEEGGEGSYVIGPENLIQIKILGQAGVNQIYRVDEAGFVNHALVGPVHLGGLTVTEVEKLMESKLAGDYIINPQVSAFILEHSHFSLLGEIRKPGSYEILGRASIIEAISMAGGFTPVANQRDVKIHRKNAEKQETITIDTTKITQRGDRSSDIYIEADDVVVVSKSFF